MTDLQAIRTSTKTIALIGASNKPERPSYHVMEFLLAKGYKVYPVNPGLAGQEILGQTVYASLLEVPNKVDMVDIFRNADAVPAIVDEAIISRDRLGIKTIWMQLGVINEDAATVARDAGFNVVMDRCPAIEWR